jgi:hypothetical protein
MTRHQAFDAALQCSRLSKIQAAANNRYKGKAAVNAIDLRRLLGIKDTPVPDELAKAYPQLRGDRLESP